jgi:hypothetical protein
MRFDSSDKMLSAGFDVIRQYDPQLYADMVRCDWYVSTDIRSVMGDRDIDSFEPLYVLMSAYGWTLPRAEYGETPSVFINAPDILDWAQKHGVPVAMFAADVLTHEYRHVTDDPDSGTDDEPSAFKAGSAFATKLPAPYGKRIKALSDKTLRKSEHS